MRTKKRKERVRDCIRVRFFVSFAIRQLETFVSHLKLLLMLLLMLMVLLLLLWSDFSSREEDVNCGFLASCIDLRQAKKTVDLRQKKYNFASASTTAIK